MPRKGRQTQYVDRCYGDSASSSSSSSSPAAAAFFHIATPEQDPRTMAKGARASQAGSPGVLCVSCLVWLAARVDDDGLSARTGRGGRAGDAGQRRQAGKPASPAQPPDQEEKPAPPRPQIERLVFRPCSDGAATFQPHTLACTQAHAVVPRRAGGVGGRGWSSVSVPELAYCCVLL